MGSHSKSLRECGGEGQVNGTHTECQPPLPPGVALPCPLELTIWWRPSQLWQKGSHVTDEGEGEPGAGSRVGAGSMQPEGPLGALLADAGAGLATAAAEFLGPKPAERVAGGQWISVLLEQGTCLHSHPGCTKGRLEAGTPWLSLGLGAEKHTLTLV